MQEASIHSCQCAVCREAQPHPDKQLHHRMNLLVSRMNERQRRWYAGHESMRVGHGGDKLLEQITGMHSDTIRLGRRELETDLSGRPLDRVRLEGGGRPPVEKKILPLNRTC